MSLSEPPAHPGDTVRSLVVLLAALAFASPTSAAVVVYPSSQTLPASGPLPPGGGRALALNVAIGEREGAWVVVAGATNVAVSVDASGLGPLKPALFFGHFVAFGPRIVPDALLPWDGIEKGAEKPNQPIYVQVLVPYDAKPGSYTATITVSADGRPTTLPLTVRVFGVALPEPINPAGNLLTSFHLAAESYVAKAAQLYGYTSNSQRLEANTALYSFLANYRISPGSWGFGEPGSRSGYITNGRWWLDSVGNMIRENAIGFSAMRLPISSQRTSERNYIAGISPFQPDSWCDYLRSVRGFWEEHGWLGRTPYLYTLDEPGLAGQRLVARQAAAAHRCFPESRMLMTGNPSPDGTNSFLWDNTGDDDVDIWVVLSRRFYGQFTNPKATASRARRNLAAIERARRLGKTVWSYTYNGVSGTPGFGASEPLSNPRMLLLWNALEGIPGLLYGQGTTSYRKGNPLESVDRSGEFVLLYPGAFQPIASARLEQIRDGIEDWAVFDVVARKRGLGAVRGILGAAGLFSSSATEIKLACHLGCALKSATKYSWPAWSHDASTPARIERAKLQALTIAAG